MNPNPALLQQAPSFQAANRRDPIIRSPEARRPSLESAIGSQQTTLEPTPDSFLQNEDNTSENMTGSRHRLRAADNSPVPESSAGGSSAPMDAAESALMDMRNSRCLPGCGLPSRSGTEGSAFAGLRTFQHPESVSSTSWSALAQNPLQAASEELKTLLALLAPKSSGSGQTADFLSQLVGRIHAQLLNHESIIRVQLRPANLGRMEIKAETSSAGLQATIITESSSIKDYLESNLPLLQQNFQDQGLKVDRIQVAVQQDPLSQQSSSGSQESSSGANRNGSSGFTTGRAGRQERAEDELVLDQAALAAMNPHGIFHAIA
jgi:flagellar hook-length control protein FliK